MPGIGVINNPRSRQNKKHPERIRKLGYILGHGGESKETWTFEALDRVLQEFKKRDIDILAINGGDGSNHVTLSSLIKLYGKKPLPKIALMRGGTLNTISDGCGIKGNTTGILYNITEKYGNDEPFNIVHRDTLKIGDQYSFLFGNGIVAKFMETYYSTGTPSPSHGAKVLMQGAVSAFLGTELTKHWTEPLIARVTLDGWEVPNRRWTSMLGATVPELGLGFTPFPRYEDEPGTFHMSLLDGSPTTLVMNLAHIYFGRAISHKLGFEVTAKEVKIESESPWPYQLDGEIYQCESGSLAIEVGPRLEIIVN